jgi:hypothetical protein
MFNIQLTKILLGLHSVTLSEQETVLRERPPYFPYVEGNRKHYLSISNNRNE